MIELIAIGFGGCCLCGAAFGTVFAGIWIVDRTYQWTFGRI